MLGEDFGMLVRGRACSDEVGVLVFAGTPPGALSGDLGLGSSSQPHFFVLVLLIYLFFLYILFLFFYSLLSGKKFFVVSLCSHEVHIYYQVSNM